MSDEKKKFQVPPVQIPKAPVLKPESVSESPIQKPKLEVQASDSPEIKTLKEYVSLKEKEVVSLQQDFSRAKEQLDISEKKTSELDYQFKKMQEQQGDLIKKVDRLTLENEELRTQHAKALESRQQQIQTKSDKLLMAERKADLAQKKYEELKERIARDIKHIRVREKELEAKLEIVKRDSETLLASKDKKLLEFRRKMDALEYEIESFREKEKALRDKVHFWKDRMDRVARALKLGSSLLEDEEDLSSLEQEGEETLTSAKLTKKSA